MAAGSGSALVAGHAWAAGFELPADQLERWRHTLFSTAQPLRYLSDQHTDARLHLGGIGTGNFEIGSDGQFTTWQLFNTLRDGSVPFHFLLRAGTTTKLLQTRGGPEWPRVRQIEMTGEYPFARLRYLDAELPVAVELTAFSPFAPLNSELSSTPLVGLIFRLHNPGKQSREVALAGLVQNAVGYEADDENPSLANPCFGGNFNQVLHQDNLAGLVLRALPAPEPALDKPVWIHTLSNLDNLALPPRDHPENLAFEVIRESGTWSAKMPDPAHTVLWFEEAPAGLAPSFLSSVLEAVQAGATLLLSGKSQPLLQAYASWTGGKLVDDVSIRPDILFEDFEGTYEKWQVQGEAFGTEPAHGTLPNQQQVSGFLGHGLVNTYLNGDDTQGRLISKPFQIKRRFIRFLVGGGRHEQAQIRLVLDGKVVRTASGKDNERLEPAIWDVQELAGRTAHLEIVDAQTGGWGHINVDQIEFSDLPGPRELLVLLEKLLPARFSAVRTVPDQDHNLTRLEFDNLLLHPGADRVAANNGLLLFFKRVGKGKVVLASGAVLDPRYAALSSARRQAYAFVCWLVRASTHRRPAFIRARRALARLRWPRSPTMPRSCPPPRNGMPRGTSSIPPAGSIR